MPGAINALLQGSNLSTAGTLDAWKKRFAQFIGMVATVL